MELAATALTSLATTVGNAFAATTAGAGAVAGAATGAGAAAGAGGLLGGLAKTSSILSLLQGGLTIAAAAAEGRRGREEARALDFAAEDARRESQMEDVRFGERRIGLRRQLLQQLGDIDTQAAASGVQLGFGTPAAVRQEAIAETDRVIDIERNTMGIRQARLAERASEFNRSATMARSAARLRGLGILAQGGLAIAQRG